MIMQGKFFTKGFNKIKLSKILELILGTLQSLGVIILGKLTDLPS